MIRHRNKENALKSHRILLIVPVLFLAVSLCLLSAQVQDRVSAEYRIGPQDLLEISVFGLDVLNKTVRVSEDGKIALPLIGEVLIDGLTKSEVEKKLTGLLEEKYLQNPQVSVFIREYQSKKVSLIGAVGNPGPYDLLGRQTLLQIISHAGGITNEAGKDIIIIREHKDGTNESLAISIEDLIMKGDPALNIPLEPNDIISVPIDQPVKIYVFGQVRNPGALEVRKSHIPTLLQAIGQAGGFSDRASKSGVLIKRIDEKGREFKLKVNVGQILKNQRPDIQLKAYDVVYVGKAVF